MKKNQLQKNTQAVSVVIGALMLTLIVVTAAVSFSIFTAQKQEEIQDQEWSELLMKQEQLQVLSINDISYNTTDTLTNITFTVVSQHTRDSRIQALRINDRYIMNFTVEHVNTQIKEKWNLTGKGYRIYSRNNATGDTWDDYVMGSSNLLRIKPKEVLRFQVDNITENASGLNVDINNPLTIEVGTSLTNTFEKTFIPPTANIQIIEETESLLLDGSQSFTDDDTHIVEYEWILTNLETNDVLPKMYGKQINANRILTDNTNVTDYSSAIISWDIKLNITNNQGMIASNNITYQQDFREKMAEDESLEITEIEPTYNETNTEIITLSFTIKSNSEYDSNITTAKINSNTIEDIDKDNTLDIPFYSSVTTSEENLSIPLEQSIIIRIKTALGNTFEKTFYPPDANIVLNLETVKINETTYDDLEFLDGTQSDHPGDGYIVEWIWHISTEPYLFNDSNIGDWNYTYSDDVNDSDPDRDYKYNSGSDGDLGGLYALDDNDEPFVWQEVPQQAPSTTTFAYDTSDIIISYDPDGNGIKANPRIGMKGGLYAIDSADCIVISSDNSYNAVDDEVIAGVEPKEGQALDSFYIMDWSIGYYDADDDNTWDENEDCLILDVDFDDKYTPQPDQVVDADGSSLIGGDAINDWNDVSGLSISVGDTVSAYTETGTGCIYYTDTDGISGFSKNDEIYWDNNNNGSDSNDEIITSGADNIANSWTNQEFFTSTDNIAIEGVNTTYNDGEDIIINYGGDTYHNSNDVLIAGSLNSISQGDSLTSNFSSYWTNMKKYNAIADEDSDETTALGDWDPYEEPYIFNFTNNNSWKYDSDEMLNNDTDGDGIYANPHPSDKCGLYACEAITLYGRKIKAEFLYEDEDMRDHYITLTVIDNYGMKSTTTMTYKH